MNLKARLNFKWSCEPDVKKEQRGNHCYFFMRCECGTQKWVCYTHLKKEKSSCCQKCSRLPTLEKMKAVATKFNYLWTPTIVNKSIKRRRYFLMKCICGKLSWVSWARYSQGHTAGCKSCTRRRAFGTLNKKLHFYKHPLMSTWRKLRVYTIRDKNILHWKTFDEFKEWALNSGFTENSLPKLRRKDTKLPFSPENCFWDRTKETGRTTVRERNFI